MNTKTKDMTVGSPTRLILQFAIPLLFGGLFQQVYSMVDAAIVGRFLGVNDLAAVGATGSINYMLIGFSMGCCFGFSLPVAQRFGAKDECGMHRYIAVGMLCSGVLALVMTVSTTLLCRQILVLMKTPADILDGAYQYLWVLFLGIPGMVLYNYLTGVLRAVGDSKTPVVFLVLTSLLNVVLDLLFVVVFHWGVAGAAWATLAAQLLSGVAILLYAVFRTTLFQIPAEDWRFHREQVVQVLNMGLPMGLQTSITAIGGVLLQSAVNSLSAVAVVGTTVGGRLLGLMLCPIDALSGALAAYGGQNFGARKIARIREGVRQSLLLGGGYTVLASALMWLFAKYMVLLFVSPEETDVIESTVIFLRFNGTAFITVDFLNQLRTLIQGVGYSKIAVFGGVFELIARVLVAMFIVPAFGYFGACFANPLAWVLADLFFIPAYLFVMRRLTETVVEPSV